MNVLTRDSLCLSHHFFNHYAFPAIYSWPRKLKFDQDLAGAFKI